MEKLFIISPDSYKSLDSVNALLSRPGSSLVQMIPFPGDTSAILVVVDSPPLPRQDDLEPVPADQ